MTRNQFIYALTACGCLLKDGKTWYEHNELIKCFEDLGLFEQEPVLDKIRAEIEEQMKMECFDTDDEMFAYRTGLENVIDMIDKY